MRKSTEGGLVYSTEGGRMCPACRQPLAACACAVQSAAPRGDGIVRVSRETQGRGGKTVTVVRGFVGDAAALAALCNSTMPGSPPWANRSARPAGRVAPSRTVCSKCRATTASA